MPASKAQDPESGPLSRLCLAVYYPTYNKAENRRESDSTGRLGSRNLAPGESF